MPLHQVAISHDKYGKQPDVKVWGHRACFGGGTRRKAIIVLGTSMHLARLGRSRAFTRMAVTI